ncbi:hypothetical protein ACLX1H_002675 [Fusarium chlamydosporum]
MEPPTKKRRQGSSSQKDVQDEDDDDELASHPQEIKIRRDPDIQFALKRANANQKLNATMAHIIEKYSRNFEGIGDEIDIATGEIVVNNGHLRNMRDEGDVEGLWVEGDSNMDEDEGILLGDLTDEYSDGEGPVKEIRDSQADSEDTLALGTQETGIDADQHGQDGGADEATNSLSNITTGQNGSLLFDLPHGDPELSPPPFGPGPSFGYGMPPPGFGPWGMMPGFHMQAWGRDDIPPYFSMPPSMPGPWYDGGRYEFPSSRGQASIWGRNWARKTKQVGSMKSSFKKPSDKQSDTVIVDSETETPDHDRGSKSQSTEGNPQKQGPPPLSDRTIDASDEDDFLYSGTTDPAPILKSSPFPSSHKSSPEKRMIQDPTNKTLQETDGNDLAVSRQSGEKDDSGRRRSGRARKQTEYMGKISWNDAREWKKSGKTFTVEVQRADPSLREEFQTVDLSHDNNEEDEPSLPERTQSNSSLTEPLQTKVAFPKLVVPDSQDTATPFNSSAPQASESEENATRPRPIVPNTLPNMELSDDEAPLALSRIRVPRRQTKPSTATYPISGGTTGHHDDYAGSTVTASTALETNNEISPEIGIGSAVVDAAVQSLKRKRGRPKGSRSFTKPTPHKTSVAIPTSEARPASLTPTSLSTTGGLVQSTNRKRGRPRKSNALSPDVENAVEDHTHEDAPVDDAAFGENQQGLAHEVTGHEDPETSHRLSHELRWLLKTKPQDSPPPRTRESSPNERVRSRRSRDMLQHTEDKTEKPPDVIQEVVEPVEDTEHEPKEQPVLEAQESPAQEAETTMEETSEDGEVSEAVQDDQPLPISPASPLYDDEIPKYGKPPNDNEHGEESSPIINTITDEGDVDNEERLPTLPEDAPARVASTPRKPKDTRKSLVEPPSSSLKPRTPRHRSIRTNRAPSSRRSLLSFVSDSDSDTGGSRDELTRQVKSHSKSTSARPSSKIWRSTALTREIHRTPSRRGGHEMSSPVKTPGGTARICGVDGYHCGRDYCFTCI